MSALYHSYFINKKRYSFKIPLEELPYEINKDIELNKPKQDVLSNFKIMIISIVVIIISFSIGFYSNSRTRELVNSKPIFNSNMTIMDFVETGYIDIFEPYLWGVHKDGHSGSFIEKYNTGAEQVKLCDIKYIKDNLHYEQNEIYLKMPENTFCWTKDSGLQYVLTSYVQGTIPCNKFKFENMYKWCNIQLLFDQMIEIIKAYEKRRYPNDIIRFEHLCIQEQSEIQELYSYIVKSRNINNLIFYSTETVKLVYSSFIYNGLIQQFNFYNSFNH